MALLDIQNLRVYFNTDLGIAKAVDKVSYKVNEGKIFGVVGESGSGKSVTALSIMKLVEGQIQKNSKILFNNKNLIDFNENEMRKIRGNEISMIFQEPMTSLNPVYTIYDQISEVIKLHLNLNKEEVKERTIKMLQKVGIPSPEKRLKDYPHHFSGGMRQRVMIAMALACDPKLLIADEPTTALDVTIQAQILELMKNLVKEFNSSVLLITHDLGVVAEVCDEVAVMYAGKIMEKTTTKELFKNTSHPYTIGLLKSIPNPKEKVKRLNVIDGIVPSSYNWPLGCRFCDRCKDKMKVCENIEPPFYKLSENHFVRCHLYENNNIGKVEE